MTAPHFNSARTLLCPEGHYDCDKVEYISERTQKTILVFQIGYVLDIAIIPYLTATKERLYGKHVSRPIMK